MSAEAFVYMAFIGALLIFLCIGDFTIFLFYWIRDNWRKTKR